MDHPKDHSLFGLGLPGYISCHMSWTSPIQNRLFSKLTQKLCQLLNVNGSGSSAVSSLPSCQLSMPRKFILMTPPAKAFGFLRKAIMFLAADKQSTQKTNKQVFPQEQQSLRTSGWTLLSYILELLDLELIRHFSASSTSKTNQFWKLQQVVIP